jgi:hypothetical protein
MMTIITAEESSAAGETNEDFPIPRNGESATNNIESAGNTIHAQGVFLEMVMDVLL